MIIDTKTYIKFYGSSSLEGTDKLHKFECGWCHLPYYSSRKETKYCCQSHRVMASMDRAKKVKRAEEILKKPLDSYSQKPVTLLEQIQKDKARVEKGKFGKESMEKIKKDNRHIPGY